MSTSREKWWKDCNGTATKDSVREFGEVTSLHGVRYVTEPQSPIFIRLCWGVAILMCTVFCGFEIYKLYTRWQESPVITVLAQKPTHVTSVPFPAVTICPGNKVLRSAFDIDKSFDELLNYTNSNDSDEEQNILAESIVLLCRGVSSFLNFDYHVEPTDEHLEMISQISPNINNLFEECVFQDEERNCSEIFRPILTREGLCFTFNMLSTEEIFNEKYQLPIKGFGSVKERAISVALITCCTNLLYHKFSDGIVFFSREGFLCTSQQLATCPDVAPADPERQVCQVMTYCHFSQVETLIRPIVAKFLTYYMYFKSAGEEQENKDIILEKSSWRMEHGYKSRTTNYYEDLISRNEYPFREHTHLGPDTGLTVILKNNVNEVQDSCATLQNGQNFLVTLHSPHEFPTPERKYFFISPDSTAMVAVDPEQLMADDELRPPRYTPEIRGCHFPEERPGFVLKNMTEQNCYFDSILESAVNNCNCSLFPWPIKDTMNDILPFCAVTEETCYAENSDVEEIIASCLPSCYEINYDNYKISTSRYKWDKTNTSEENIKYTYLTVFFNKATFFPLKKSELYGTTDFIANSGGLLGLFTGFSIISGIEIFYFATLRFCFKLRESQRQAKKDTEDADAQLNGIFLQS